MDAHRLCIRSYKCNKYISLLYFDFLDHHKKEKNHSPSSIHTNSSKLGSVPAAPSSLTSVANSVNVVHMSVRKTQSDPPDQLPPGRPMLSEQPPPPPGPKNNFRPEPPMLMPRNPTTSVVVIEHTTKMAVNNNVGEENNQI